jgi:hypothetical protein
MEKLTIDNNELIFNRLKNEIVKDISSRKELITFNFNGEDITLQKIFWIYNTLLLTMVKDFEKVNTRDLITDTFNSKIFEKFVNKFLDVDNKHQVAKILTEFSKLSVIGNNKLDTGLSLKNIIDGYLKYEDFRNIIDNIDSDGNPILNGDEDIYEVERKFAEGIVNMRKVLSNKPDLWFYDFVKNGEGLNFKQLFQTIGFVGSKPVVNFDFRNNGVNSDFIKSNFIRGTETEQEYYINCMSARKAQTVNRMLIQPSGYFMRRLSLLTIDTTHNNKEEDCGTDKGVIVHVNSSKELSMIDGRHYITEKGIETIDAEKDIHLIGETLTVRSPITCKHSHTTGVCRTCFGKDLASKLQDFNSGMLAVLNFTEQLTQNMLNAKHFSSTSAEKVDFSKEFYSIFTEEGANNFSLNEDVEIVSVTNYEIDYSPEYENEDDEDGDSVVTESIHLTGLSSSEDKFSVITYKTKGETKEYILDNDIYLVLDRDIDIDYSLENNKFLDLSNYEVVAAYFIIQNNELATGMKKILAVIDNNTFIKQLNDNMDMTEIEKASALLEKFNSLLIYYKLDFIRSWNVEMILSNLFFDINKENFDFSDTTKAMEIYPVPKALREHRSLAVSLSYERLKDQFSDPYTFTKNRKSNIDNWFK